MFDFSWSEIMVIGVVALVLIGPKDMPVAVRAITRVLKKMRRMASEFQGHVDEMMREADLGEVQSTLRDLRGMGLKGAINRVVDPDGSVSRAFEDPFTQHSVPPVVPGRPRAGVAMQPLSPRPDGPAPAFIPPGFSMPPPDPPKPFVPPSFVPPAALHPDAASDEKVADDI
jgi:sec-independent protein translocase protein TatB